MMKIPAMKGVIDRRILVNYRVDSDVLRDYLPEPFKPKLIKGYGMAGICLIRLQGIRPKGIPIIGISSENAAHRIAVQWKEGKNVKEGVYVTRRDTSSRLVSLAGGRIFPGVHYYSKFDVCEEQGNYSVQFRHNDTYISITAKETHLFPSTSVFDSLESASEFFEKGSVGYSPGRNSNTFDGLELKSLSWEVKPLEVLSVSSSFFEDEKVFPKGSVEFDHALLMANIKHEWHSLDEIVQNQE